MRKNRIFLQGNKRRIVINELTKKYGYKCWYCGVSLDNIEIHIDHVIPLSHGGLNDTSNYALSCKFCNCQKFHYSVVEFLEYLAHIRTGAFCCPILKEYGNKLEPTTRDVLSKSFY